MRPQDVPCPTKKLIIYFIIGISNIRANMYCFNWLNKILSLLSLSLWFSAIQCSSHQTAFHFIQKNIRTRKISLMPVMKSNIYLVILLHYKMNSVCSVYDEGRTMNDSSSKRSLKIIGSQFKFIIWIFAAGKSSMWQHWNQKHPSIACIFWYPNNRITGNWKWFSYLSQAMEIVHNSFRCKFYSNL